MRLPGEWWLTSCGWQSISSPFIRFRWGWRELITRVEMVRRAAIIRMNRTVPSHIDTLTPPG